MICRILNKVAPGDQKKGQLRQYSSISDPNPLPPLYERTPNNLLPNFDHVYQDAIDDYPLFPLPMSSFQSSSSEDRSLFLLNSSSHQLNIITPPQQEDIDEIALPSNGNWISHYNCLYDILLNPSPGPSDLISSCVRPVLQQENLDLWFLTV